MKDVVRDLERDIDALIRQVLRVSPTRTGALSRSELAEWDSLKHMELIFALEDRYDVRFDETEFPTLVSTDAIAAALRSRLAA